VILLFRMARSLRGPGLSIVIELLYESGSIHSQLMPGFPPRRANAGISLWWDCAMTTKALKEIIDRVQRWPEARQEDAARVLREMEEQDTGAYRLTDEQVAEVERRRTNPNRRFQDLAAVKARFAQSKA